MFFILGSFLLAQKADAADVTFSVRYQDQLLFSGQVPLPSSGTVALLDTNGVSHTVNSKSVLALLSSIDASSSAFDISQLQYFSSFNSFYLKCMGVAVLSLQACDNWQYVVDGSHPFTGMDQNIHSPY